MKYWSLHLKLSLFHPQGTIFHSHMHLPIVRPVCVRHSTNGAVLGLVREGKGGGAGRILISLYPSSHLDVRAIRDSDRPLLFFFLSPFPRSYSQSETPLLRPNPILKMRYGLCCTGITALRTRNKIAVTRFQRRMQQPSQVYTGHA